MSCPTYEDAIHRTRILDLLAPYDPHVVGTLPLGIALPDSDIDIVCHAPDPDAVAELVWTAFSSTDDFALYRWSARGRPLIAKFETEGWPFEIFASPEPVADQPGWQHFRVEQQLLDLGGFALRDQVMALRMQGMKTEPAFATVLGLTGDPYAALSALYGMPTVISWRSSPRHPTCRTLPWPRHRCFTNWRSLWMGSRPPRTSTGPPSR